MTVFQAIFLGAVQGLTEFLPVSSSGHLALFQLFFGMRDVEGLLLFDVVLHLGTLIPVIVLFRRELTEIVRGLIGGAGKRKGEGDLAAVDRWQPRYLALSLVVGTIPAALAGATMKDGFERLIDSWAAVSTALLVTGTVLYSTRWAGRERKGLFQIGLTDSVLIGLAQAAAITPGISRSGSTISAALFLGVERESAAKFSFLLSIPAILGAMALQLIDLGAVKTMDISVPVLLAGFLSSMVVGYAALKLLMMILRGGKFSSFAYYCWAIGALGWILGVLNR